MGTITPRTNTDGAVSYKAQVRLRRQGAIVHQETQTFAREQAAKAWVKKRETELAKPGALEQARAGDPTLAEVIQRYITDRRIPLKRDKASTLTLLSNSELGRLRCSEVTGHALYQYAKSLKLAPSTINGYFAYLGSVYDVAKPLWGYPLEPTVLREARDAMREMGVTAPSERRDRRPTLAEMDRIVEYLRRRHLGYKRAMPVEAIVLFAIFSTRRLGEILRLAWSDIDEARCQILVYDMKDPKKKIGNHVWVDITPEALQVLRAMPRIDNRVFPYSVSSVSDAFKEACGETSVADLTFHDLRHEGISRLFEMGYSIPMVAMMSGHKTWANLKRYTHLRHKGDKYANWPWLDIVAPLPQRPLHVKPHN